MKTATLEDGQKVTLHRPSANFNPLNATSAELVKNGFPAVPDAGPHRERFNKLLGQLKNKLHYIEPTFRVNQDKKHGLRVRAASDGTETSTNWSGAVVNAPAGDSFRWIQGDWVIPDVDAPTENAWYYSASWIGIDGDGSNDVFQAGVECEVFRSGNSITRRIYPWWEWFPTAEIEITNLPVNPGDMVTMLLCSTSPTAGVVFFTNRTTGASTSVGLSAPHGTKLVGNCAEWIVEAPTVNGAQSAMADYGEVFFSVCEAFTQKGVTVNGGTGDNINMTAGGSTVSDGILVAPTVVECLYAGTLA
jgi:Peptidase A4 family